MPKSISTLYRVSVSEKLGTTYKLPPLSMIFSDTSDNKQSGGNLIPTPTSFFFDLPKRKNASG